MANPEGTGICNTEDHLLTRILTLRESVIGFPDDRIMRAFGPVVQLVFGAGSDTDTAAHSPVRNRGHPVLVDRRPATVDLPVTVARLQRHRVLPPMDKVFAGDMCPAVAFIVLHNVEEVIPSLPVDGTIWVKRMAYPFLCNNVVSRSIRIQEKLGSQFSRAIDK